MCGTGKEMTEERVIEAQSQEPSQTPVLASAALSYTATPNNPLLRHEPQVVDMLFDRVPMGVAILDSSFSVLRYNPTWADFVAQYTPSHAHELAYHNPAYRKVFFFANK